MPDDNKILKQPEILSRIDEVRKQFSGSEDEAVKFDQWETDAKKSLLVLALNGHEGIEMLKQKAKDEIKERYEVLKSARPRDLTPNGAIAYANERAFNFMAIDLWTWFLSLFTDAQDALADIDREIVSQQETGSEEEINN